MRHPGAPENQLTAILSEAVDCELRILPPMADDVVQLDAIEGLLARARARPGVQSGVLGAMIETPAPVEHAAEHRAGGARAAVSATG